MTWSPADLIVLVPVLGRPDTFAPLLESLQATTPGASVLWLATAGYRATLTELDRLDQRVEIVGWRSTGDYARKINHGVRVTDQPLIFMGACDLRFHAGWFEHAVDCLSDRIQVVGTNDLGNLRTVKGNHSTHSLLTRQYARLGTIDDPTRVLHEGYVHEFVDDEFVGTAKYRAAFQHCPESEVEHLHPMWHREIPWDDSYRGQADRMRKSRPLYRNRRRMWRTR